MISLVPWGVMGKDTWGCRKLCYACSTQTLIITSSAGNSADEYPRWPHNRWAHCGSWCWSSHIILYCRKWKEDGCPARSGHSKCDYITNKKERGEDSIWEEVHHTGRVALVPVRDWEKGVLIMTRYLHLQGSSFGCLTWKAVVSKRRSLAMLGGPEKTLERCSLFDKYNI